jgi:hypothetical protein
MDSQGNFYGTTGSGGAFGQGHCRIYGCGVAYELSPPGQAGGTWTEKLLHVFGKPGDGTQPIGGLVADKDNNLYGITGSGTIFELTPGSGGKWQETVLFTAAANGDEGAYFDAGLTIDKSGNLFGVAPEGGSRANCTVVGCGLVFELSPPSLPGGVWTFSVIYDFEGQSFGDGTSPTGILVLDPAGDIYGTTGGGGIYNFGTTFELSPPSMPGGTWTEAVLYSFTDGEDGFSPAGINLVGRNLYGIDSGGLVQCVFYNNQEACGQVFELSPKAGGAWTETTLHDFQGSPDGGDPEGQIILGKSRVGYGVTYGGGDPNCPMIGGQGCGTVYAIKP